MDEETLVDRLIAEGARLESGLVRRVPSVRQASASAFVALDVELQEWQILLPLPEGMSRLKVYGALQEIIQDLELSLTVDRIVLIKATDPGLRELRGSSSPYSHQGGASQAAVEVAGRFFTGARELRINPRLFEQQILNLLRESLSGYARVMTGLEAARADDLDAGHQYIELRGMRALSYADIIVFGESSLLLVEAKAARHPITMGGVLSGLGLLSYFQRIPFLHPAVKMIFVSASGFTPQVERDLVGFDDLYLESWNLVESEYNVINVARRAL